ncbi:hypothetical protein Hte_011797 [Hypoxylon texense]
MDLFRAQIRRPKPQIALTDFGHDESPVVVRGRKLRLTKPFNGTALLNWVFNIEIVGHPYDGMYVYRPLPDRNIRLLELFAGDALDELEGTLQHVSLDDKPSYQAISYAWGFSIKPFVLHTPEGAVGITASLCFGLRRLRKKRSSIVVWADAICIDQSNAEEKSRQVRLMPEIFKTAERVSVWTGQEADDSDHALELIRRMATSAEAEAPETAANLEESAVWDSVNKFFKRPWFQRAWIAQELVLARQVIIMCGKESAQWDDIYVAARKCFQNSQKSTTDIMKHIGRNVSAVLSLGALRLSCHKGEDDNRRRLLTLIQSFHHTKATLQRDKLFALLGLASDAQDPNFNPDYASPLETIVLRYAGVFVGRGSAIELLYRAGSPSPRFPSWIPDWFTNTPKQTISNWPSTPRGFTTCTSFASNARLSPDDNTILVSKGYVFDSIETVSETSFEQSGCLSYLKELSDLISTCSSYPNEESIKDLMWKIPIGDLMETTTRFGEQVDFRAAYQALIEYLELEEDRMDWKTEVTRMRALGRIKHFLFRPDELRSLLWPYLRAALEFAEKFSDARAGKTRQGYVGILPGRALSGDTIVILHGSAVPFLVRESRERPGHYIHLGESYIHGIMRGVPPSAEGWREVDIKLL